MRTETRGLLLGLLAVAAFSLTLPATRAALVSFDPVFVCAARIVLAAAFELLEAASRVPARGGVLTPAAAFRGPQSTLRARLESLGACKFEVLQPAKTVS